jgi:hypothetical protein
LRVRVDYIFAAGVFLALGFFIIGFLAIFLAIGFLAAAMAGAGEAAIAGTDATTNALARSAIRIRFMYFSKI